MTTAIDSLSYHHPHPSDIIDKKYINNNFNLFPDTTDIFHTIEDTSTEQQQEHQNTEFHELMLQPDDREKILMI